MLIPRERTGVERFAGVPKRSALSKRTLIACALLLGLVISPSAASAKWASSASVTPISRASSVNPGNAPGVSASGRTVNLSWGASTLATGAPVTGYIIKRYDSTGTVQQTIASGTCSATVSGTSCSETSVPEGTWRYSVTPVHNNWRGPREHQELGDG